MLVKKFEKQPLCHLLSTYVIWPVACDENPFMIYHKNKQTMNVRMPMNPKNNTIHRNDVDDKGNQSSEDSEFETVKTDKKRLKKGPVREPVKQTNIVNQQFPASDPTKVKVMGPYDPKKPGAFKKQGEKEQPEATVTPPANTEETKKEAPTAPVEVPKKAEPAKPKAEVSGLDLKKAKEEVHQDKKKPHTQRAKEEKKEQAPPQKKAPVEKEQPKAEKKEEKKPAPKQELSEIALAMMAVQTGKP